MPTSPATQSPTPAAARLNVLLVGGGGREHAIAWKLRQSPRLGELYAIDTANPGLAALCKPVDVGAGTEPFTLAKREFFPIRQWCAKHKIDLVVVGPEEPLAAGMADALREPIVPGAPVPMVFGPTRAAAQLEADKAWAKELMRSALIPTATGRSFTDHESAKAYFESRQEPPVIKASGLARGKGVFVPATKEEGLAALDRIMVKREFGDAGRTVVIEERLKGREVSVFALVDGRSIYILEACQDHKRLGDGATGPNTGGMGALCPTPALDEPTLSRIEREVLVPTVDALRRDGIEFTGVLYAGLMLTPGGPKVLEYNVRFGDPECQVLMRRLKSDLVSVLEAACTRRLDEITIEWERGPAVCVVLAAKGYPDAPRKGDVIDGLDDAATVPGAAIFHAGTTRDQRGRIVTAGGRVLNVTGQGATLDEARRCAYAAAERIRFDGKTLRTDIGTNVVG